jgi:hypothetical protein
MAIFHFNIRTIQRSEKGGHTAEQLSYMLGERLRLPSGKLVSGKLASFHRDEADSIISGVIGWAGTGQELADATESAERRQDARVARRIIVALPHELDREAQQRLVKSYCLKIRDLHGVAVAYALHPPNKRGDGRNHHAHLLLTTRRVENSKLGVKTRELDTIVSARAAVEVMREEWSKRVNAALKKAGVASRISHLSLEAQGIPCEPTRHVGLRATAASRTGRRMQTVEQNERAKREDRQITNARVNAALRRGRKARERVGERNVGIGRGRRNLARTGSSSIPVEGRRPDDDRRSSVQPSPSRGGSENQRAALSLDELKCLVPLDRFAGIHGWVLDVSGGMGGRHFQMRHPDRTREIVVSRRDNGQWCYFRREDGSGGSIIDFTQKELGWGDLGEVRNRLTQALGESLPEPERKRFASFPIAQSRGSEITENSTGSDAAHYIQTTRGLSAETLNHFTGSWLSDDRGNAIFPHTEAGGCGAEIRGPDYKGFSAGGTKGLWVHIPEQCSKLVVCESAIDAMSHAQFHGLPVETGYLSLAGGHAPSIFDAIVEFARRLGALILAAFDRDNRGEGESFRLRMYAQDSPVEVLRDAPPEGCKDWNEALRIKDSVREVTEPEPSMSPGEWERQVMTAVNLNDDQEVRRLLEYGRANFDRRDGFIEETIIYGEQHLSGEDLRTS